ncbi:hypothetical protein FCV25MIE_15412 [Fagus crenata]
MRRRCEAGSDLMLGRDAAAVRGWGYRQTAAQGWSCRRAAARGWDRQKSKVVCRRSDVFSFIPIGFITGSIVPVAGYAD